MEKILKDTFQVRIGANMAPESRVWVYQSNRFLNEDEVRTLEKKMAPFNQQWNSHGKGLNSDMGIEHGLFLILTVDESLSAASGCSIDSSVAFIKELQSELNIDFFNRMNFSYIVNDQIKIGQLGTMQQLVDDGILTNDTLVFDNMVNKLNDLRNNFTKKFADSWHQRML